jgi:hypothetical protein
MMFAYLAWIFKLRSVLIASFEQKEVSWSDESHRPTWQVFHNADLYRFIAMFL